MVIFLVGLVSMILMRTLRKDYARYSKEDDLDEMVSARVLHTCAMVLHIVTPIQWQKNDKSSNDDYLTISTLMLTLLDFTSNGTTIFYLTLITRSVTLETSTAGSRCTVTSSVPHPTPCSSRRWWAPAIRSPSSPSASSSSPWSATSIRSEYLESVRPKFLWVEFAAFLSGWLSLNMMPEIGGSIPISCVCVVWFSPITRRHWFHRILYNSIILWKSTVGLDF